MLQRTCAHAHILQTEKNKFSLCPGVSEILKSKIPVLLDLDGFGNGRDVKRIFTSSLTHRASRIAVLSNEIDRSITENDVEEAIGELLTARRPKSRTLMGSRNHVPHVVDLPMMNRERNANRPSLSLSTQKILKQVKDVDQGEEEEETTVKLQDERDEGVTDEEWAELKIAKMQAGEEEQKLKRQQEEYLSFLKQKEEENRLARIAFEQEQEMIKKELEEKVRREEERKLFEKEERRKEQLRLERKRREEEEMRRREKMREIQRMKAKLQQLRPCPAGFNWFKTGSGWRCGGGSHFVSDEELNRSFTS